MTARTDYSKIAETYDQGYKRKEIPRSRALAERPELSRVLDVACGTGNWLEIQRQAFEDREIRFTGLDASSAMLERARAKLPPEVPLHHGRAEELPFDDHAFDLVVCNFAFHHFDDKPAAIAELARVCAPGGSIELTNACPEHMPRWWSYRFFPASRAADDARFWTTAQHYEAFERAGLKTRVETSVRLYEASLSELLAEARRRDMSQLAVIDDADYAAGLEALREAVASEATIVDQFALLTARGVPA